MQKEQFILLDGLRDNPYQPRLVDDAEHIEKLARSIAADGLQQYPKARGVAVSSAHGHYELAFGHSRRKAFEWLNEHYKAEGLPNRYDAYTGMPVFVESLSDEEMYRLAVTENVQRKDLDPIEQARAMKRYADDFGKNSKEIGELFGVSDATVRGKVRLLDLPNEAQEMLSRGEVSEGAARLMLSLQKLGTTEDLLLSIARAKNTDPSDGTFEEALEREMTGLDHLQYMWDDDRGKKAMSKAWGDDAFPLDAKKFPNDLLPTLSYDDAKDALRLERNSNLQINDAALREAGRADLADKFKHLLAPTACNVCRYYAKVNGRHYCGVKKCHERKTSAWKAHQFNKAVKVLGIPLYTEADGPYRLLDSDTEEGLWTRRSKDLRLMPRTAEDGYSRQWLKGFPHELGKVVLVGETLKKLRAAKKSKDEKALEEVKSAEDQRESILARANHTLKWEAARAVSQLFFGAWTDAQIGALKQSTYAWRSFHAPKEMTFADNGCGSEEAVFLGVNILDAAETRYIRKAEEANEDTDIPATYELESAAAMAVRWTTVAKTLGVTLGKPYAKIAEAFDADLAAVAAETEA